MGQKVNPKALRLGIIYNWSSRWFFSNKKLYRDTFISDSQMRKELVEKFKFASITQVDIERSINKITVIIYSVKPGMIIGRGGKGLEDVKDFIMKHIHIDSKNKDAKLDLKIEPVKKPYLNAQFVASQISERLLKSFPHRSVVHNIMNRVTEAGGKGVKIQLSGRIAGAEISRREKYFQGTIPTSTIRADVDFVAYPCLTRSGYIGIKVWIHR